MADGDDSARPSSHQPIRIRMEVCAWAVILFLLLRGDEARHEPPWQSRMLFNPTGPEQPR